MIQVGDPVRHFGDVSDKLFMRYLGRAVKVDRDSVTVRRGEQPEAIYSRSHVTRGITQAVKIYEKPVSKRGGIGFGMVNQAIKQYRVSK